MSFRPNFSAPHSLLIAIGMASMLVAAPVAPAFSETTTPTPLPKPTAAISARAKPEAAVTPRSTIMVDGFRSAKFGMDEKAVRAAIAKDFGAKDDKIQAGENAVERTQILTIEAPDLIPEGGMAQVSYVFGYTSKKLIQVGVTWSGKTDPKMTAKMLYDNGDVLRSHFMAEGYAPDSIKTNVALPNGILMFRAADSDNHATLLLLQGSYTTGEDGRKTLTPASLDLLYSADPNSPDIFKLPEGSF